MKFTLIKSGYMDLLLHPVYNQHEWADGHGDCEQITEEKQ